MALDIGYMTEKLFYPIGSQWNTVEQIRGWVQIIAIIAFIAFIIYRMMNKSGGGLSSGGSYSRGSGGWGL